MDQNEMNDTNAHSRWNGMVDILEWRRTKQLTICIYERFTNEILEMETIIDEIAFDGSRFSRLAAMRKQLFKWIDFIQIKFWANFQFIWYTVSTNGPNVGQVSLSYSRFSSTIHFNLK